MYIRQTRMMCISLILFALVLPTAAHASFFASCRVLVQITNVHPPAKSGHLGSGLKLSFKLHKITKQWGHDTSYCTRKKMIGKSYVAIVGFYKKGPSYKKVKKGTWLFLQYTFSNDDGPNGAEEDTSWIAKAFASRKAKKPTKR